jgi:hypothetical protein
VAVVGDQTVVVRVVVDGLALLARLKTKDPLQSAVFAKHQRCQQRGPHHRPHLLHPHWK